MTPLSKLLRLTSKSQSSLTTTISTTSSSCLRRITVIERQRKSCSPCQSVWYNVPSGKHFSTTTFNASSSSSTTTTTLARIEREGRVRPLHYVRPRNLHSQLQGGLGDDTRSAQPSSYHILRSKLQAEIQALPESIASQRLGQFLEIKTRQEQQQQNLSPKHVPSNARLVSPSWVQSMTPPAPPAAGYQHEMNQPQIQVCLEAMLLTFSLHVEARIAALLGQGFYTIGPCGEELLCATALTLCPHDAVALHYRHGALNLARQLIQVHDAVPMDDPSIDHDLSYVNQILLDRARAYTVSRNDPVTGGVHCSIGSSSWTYHHQAPEEHECTLSPARTMMKRRGAGDFIVTSTLASQCPAAVGRALAYALPRPNPRPDRHIENDPWSHQRPKEPSSRPLSLVTVGDGSVHNHHFWSAFHLARHARHLGIKCPVLFGIADNGLSISYRTQGYVHTVFTPGQDPWVPVFVAQGNDLMDIYSQSVKATEYTRTRSAPAVLVYQNLVRRFGHAATDRQSAYLTASMIQAMAESDHLERTIMQAVEVWSATTYTALLDRWKYIQDQTQRAMAVAASEEKVNRREMLNQVAAPLVPVPRLEPTVLSTTRTVADPVTSFSPSQVSRSNSSVAGRGPEEKPEVMRKHMTRVVTEVMEQDESIVYLGEDVRSGGYYLVTDGLAARFPRRVLDFPPDETSLLGAGMGMAQSGLLPIVEIPYAKYLDCGADMYYEIALAYWLSNGQCPNGMVIRLQGFDRGIFGGNFHTTNMLPHIPPGVDVVCYSNGEDYVRGFRNAILQAKAGRVVVSVDSTHLLNLRHLHGLDRGWERFYPTGQDDDRSLMMGFDEVRRYGTGAHMAIVTYGTGVIVSLQARRSMRERGIIGQEGMVDIIECPYLSAVPDGLREIVKDYSTLVLVDVCKAGPGSGPLSSLVCSLQEEQLLPSRWATVAAPRTYNPLGSTCTFVSVDDIVKACQTFL